MKVVISMSVKIKPDILLNVLHNAAQSIGPDIVYFTVRLICLRTFITCYSALFGGAKCDSQADREGLRSRVFSQSCYIDTQL